MISWKQQCSKITENTRKSEEEEGGLLICTEGAINQSITRLHFLSRMARESFTSITTNVFALLVFPFLLVSFIGVGEGY